MHLRQNDAINSYFIFFSISILLLELYFFLQQPNKALAKIFLKSSGHKPYDTQFT